MNSSDIRIVTRCIDYMLMHDTQGELKKETERNVILYSIIKCSRCYPR